MHTSGPRPDPLVDLGYEPRDIDPRAIAKAVVIFIVFTVTSFAVVWVWFAVSKPAIGWARDPRKPLPASPNPLLQSNITTRTDIQTLRQREALQIETYGRNPDGTVRIPIDRSIDLLAGRGIAPTGKAVAARTTGNTIPQNALPSAPTPR